MQIGKLETQEEEAEHRRWISLHKPEQKLSPTAHHQASSKDPILIDHWTHSLS